MGQKKEGECWAVPRESERRRGELRRSRTAVETIARPRRQSWARGPRRWRERMRRWHLTGVPGHQERRRVMGGAAGSSWREEKARKSPRSAERKRNGLWCPGSGRSPCLVVARGRAFSAFGVFGGHIRGCRRRGNRTLGLASLGKAIMRGRGVSPGKGEEGAHAGNGDSEEAVGAKAGGSQVGRGMLGVRCRRGGRHHRRAACLKLRQYSSSQGLGRWF